MSTVRSPAQPGKLALIAGLAGVLSFGLAYRFALNYRRRVGLPHRSPVEASPADFGLPFESVEVPSGDVRLAAWFIPAEGTSGPRPAVAVVHGWESNRGRSLAHARYLHAAGFHVLAIDVRGHGDNPPEVVTMGVPEFASDAAAAARWLADRSEVSAVGLLGHSLGGAGVIIAAASEPVARAVVAMSSPADTVRMTRKTFQVAELKVPEPIATPLAYLTAALMLIPRHHSLDDANAARAAARYLGPLFLLHGEEDHGVPVSHLGLIAGAAQDARAETGCDPEASRVQTMILPNFGHRWLYEDEQARRRIASFFAKYLAGAFDPHQAGDLAAKCVVTRPENATYGFGATSDKVAAEAAARQAARDQLRQELRENAAALRERAEAVREGARKSRHRSRSHAKPDSPAS